MSINIDFPLILTCLVLLTGLVSLLDILFFAHRRKRTGGKQSLFVEYNRSFFPVLLLVLIIRSFIVQPYRVPTGSLEPTILPGDFIGVSQYAYGLRLPVLKTKIVKIAEPRIGQITLFYWPADPAVVFVKRVIGVPGDHIQYKSKILYINGKKATQRYLGEGYDEEPEADIPVEKRLEDLNGVKHEILVRAIGGEIDDFDIVVPKGNYFMMGDNRDNSDDSRMWGFVPEENLIGRAFGILISWNPNKVWYEGFRWNRTFKGLH